MYGTVHTSASVGSSRHDLGPPPPSTSPFRYRVQTGETLSSIAAKTQTTETALLALNPLLGGDKTRRVRLYSGQQLVVEAARDVSLPPPPDCIDHGWGHMHLVRPGETLRGISALYNTTEALLRQANRRYFPLGERSRVDPGQLLHVRHINTGEMESDDLILSHDEPGNKDGIRPDVTTCATTSAVFARYTTHVVALTDTFESICRTYEISYSHFVQMNRGRYPVGQRAELVAGHRVIVPDRMAAQGAASRRHVAEVTLTKQIHVVKPGETPEELAKRYGMTYDALREFNRNYFPKGYRGEIHPGYKLVVKRPVDTADSGLPRQLQSSG